jgi:hypothetical protein
LRDIDAAASTEGLAGRLGTLAGPAAALLREGAHLREQQQQQPWNSSDGSASWLQQQHMLAEFNMQLWSFDEDRGVVLNVGTGEQTWCLHSSYVCLCTYIATSATVCQVACDVNAETVALLSASGAYANPVVTVVGRGAAERQKGSFRACLMIYRYDHNDLCNHVPCYATREVLNASCWTACLPLEHAVCCC